tara:strand:- start:793 stop:1218 length:426 start_codon:yes stop_codon:yes gene_type:complete
MNLELELTRFNYSSLETVGRLTGSGAVFWTIENPWLDNEVNVSCIPEGFYYLERYDSPTHGDGTWQFINVPARTFCQIHVANYASDVSGCIGLGLQVMAGLVGVASSRDALQSFSELTEQYDSLSMTIREGAIKCTNITQQ